MTPQQIKALRKALNLSTKELGERIGVSGRTVEDWEQGRSTPSKPAAMLLEALTTGAAK